MNNKQKFGRGSAAAIFFMLATFFSAVQAQVESGIEPKESISGILVEPFLFKSDSSQKSRLDIYVHIPYPEINFIKENDQYLSRFEISVTLHTDDEQEIWQKNQTVELQVKEFTQTISRRLFNLKQFSTEVPPGTYSLLVQITDLESKRTSTIQRQVNVRNFSADSLTMSDIMLVQKVSTAGSRKSIVPNLSGNISNESKPLYLFFEIYHQAQIDSVHFLCKFINSKREVAAEYRMGEVLKNNISQVLWFIDSLDLPAEKYVVFLEAEGFPRNNPAKRFTASQSRSCQVQIRGVPATIINIDKATEQLTYVAKNDEINYIKDALTPEEKRNRFLEFWKKRDSNPHTERNELMEEYFARVDYANNNFGNLREGWASDRGMILIRFGVPQNVERHPFDSNSKPFEIWYYYDQNRKFTFVDESGFGDYRLLYPETDLWGRMR